jgi:hypothetical protein
MPGMSIDVTDASELAGLLRFLADWTDSDAGPSGWATLPAEPCSCRPLNARD